MWVIDLLVNLSNPHPRTPPSTLEVLQARERAATPLLFIVFIFGLVIESIKELGGASLRGSFAWFPQPCKIAIAFGNCYFGGEGYEWKELRCMGNMFDSMSKHPMKDFLKTLHLSAFEKNLSERKNLELGWLLKDLFIKNRRSKGKTSLVQRPLWQCRKLSWTSFKIRI